MDCVIKIKQEGAFVWGMGPRDLENVDGTRSSEYNDNWIRKRRGNLCLPQQLIMKELSGWNLLVIQGTCEV